MSRFVTVKDGTTKIVINTDYLVNVQKISSDTIYVDYYAYDTSGIHSKVINRAEVNIKSLQEYEDLIDEIRGF